MTEPGATAPPLMAHAPATLANATLLRHEFRNWLATAAPDRPAADLVLAVYEGLVNAAEHAYRGRPDQPGPVRLHAHRDGDGLVVTISDEGTWRDQPAAGNGHRGRGLLLMAELAAHTHVDHEPGGTIVTLRC